MGGFILACTGPGRGRPGAFVAALASMRRTGFSDPLVIDRPGFRLAMYPKFGRNDLCLYERPDGDFAFACGGLILGDAIGRNAAEHLWHGFDGTPRVAAGAYGQFAAVVRKRGRTCVFADALGACQVLIDAEGGLCGTSLLALAAARDRRRLLLQSAYEYVFNGVVSGNDTLLAGIRQLPIGALATVDSGLAVERRPPTIRPPLAATREDLLEQAIERLDDYFAALARVFGDRVTCALSGGYDSRLILAMLRRHGVAPSLFVYGRPEDEDVVLAKRVAAAAGLPIAAIDKEADPPRRPPADLAETIEANFLDGDGLLWGGLFGAGAERAERRRRTGDGAATLNGGGGEIFRDFFRLPDRAFGVRQLLWSFYGGFDPRTTTRAFSARAYFDRLAAKVGEALGRPGERRLARHEVEWLYHHFRCRSWDGRTNSINLRFGHSALPFLEPPIARFAYRIPVRCKRLGGFQAELIRRTSPALAALPSAYGHSFAEPPPLRRRLGEAATRLRPPLLRRYTYRIKHRWLPPDAARRGHLAPEIVEAGLPGGVDVVKGLFRLDAVRDPMQMQRILSLEYLCRRLDAVPEDGPGAAG